jgi:hypothetical protein
MRRALVLALSAAFLVSAGIVLVVAVVGSVQANTLWFEIMKTLLQIGVVSAAGAALSIVSFEYQRDAQRTEKAHADERIRDETRKDWLRGILARAAASYTDVKRARRLLRGRALTTDAQTQHVVVRAEAYDQQLAAINDAQLEFELLADDVRTSGQQPAGVITQLGDEFDRIEKALSKLITEYEQKLPTFRGSPAVLELDQLSVL